MKCPACGKDIYQDASHWGHGSTHCPVRVYATLEDLRSSLAPWGVSDVGDLPREAILGTEPLMVDRSLALFVLTAPDQELARTFKKFARRR